MNMADIGFSEAKISVNGSDNQKNTPKIDFSNLIERFPILNISPVSVDDKYLPKVIKDEVFPISANIFREGHDKVSATAVLISPDKREFRYQMFETGPGGRDFFSTLVKTDQEGIWQFYLESWSDEYHTWEHTAWVKIENNIDIELVFQTGALLFQKWSQNSKLPTKAREVLKSTVKTLLNRDLTPDARLKVASSELVHDVWNQFPLREYVSKSAVHKIEVKRPLSSFSAWYQFFPRSIGAKKVRGGVKSGTFQTAAKHLEIVKEMGFDIIYLPPIHPIGETFRKGANNSLKTLPGDPGSPWAVGGKLANGKYGGHDEIHSELGTVADFKVFVNTAKKLGLEVSLDIALQCSPDHPWVKEHPNWFTIRPDKTIAYAENPPKKYQDIYPLNFDNEPEAIVAEILRILEYWIELGVTVLRIDNPHTKPVWVWQYLIEQVKLKHPDVIWLAEAFTLPNMMKTLGLVGFDQSHSYFPWRNTKHELEEFFNQISGDDGFWFLSTLWPTTPDILTDFLANGLEAGHAIRAVLAALGSTSWGIYSGYEFIENEQRPNPDGTFANEHINSEKYQITIRPWKDVDKVSGIKKLITNLNRIRKDHVACQSIHSLMTHTTNNDEVLCFSRHIPGRFTADGIDDTLIVIINLNPKNANQATVWFDYGAINLPDQFKVVDELNGKEFTFSHEQYVDLSPVVDVAHVLKVVRK